MSEQDGRVTPLAKGDLLYGAPAIAEYLGVTDRVVYHRAETGEIPSFKIGKTICSRKTTLTEYMEALSEQPRSAPSPEAA